MVKWHSYSWRARRDQERKDFAALLRRVEKIRLRHGMTKKAVAAEIGTAKDVLRSWLAGEAVGRAESVAKIKNFLAAWRYRASPLSRCRGIFLVSNGRGF
jgi:transcriptional regulator with XRE-family HTH domain